MKRLFTSLIAVSLLSLTSLAQSFSFKLTGSPTIDETGWTKGGDATNTGGSIQLTPSVGNKSGYIHYATPYDLSGECSYFTVEFEYKMTKPTSGTPADGLAFWYLKDPPTGFVLGGGLGMPATLTGFAIIFDVYNNDSKSDNPLVLLQEFEGGGYTEGVTKDVVGDILTNQTQVNDGSWRHVKFIYKSGDVEIYLDKETTPSITGSMPMDSYAGYFGFSASTGGSYQTHEIREVYINGIDKPEKPIVTDTTWICQHVGYDTFKIKEIDAAANYIWYDLIDGEYVQLSGAPVINSNIPNVYTYYVSKKYTECELYSEKVPATIVVRPVYDVELTAATYQICSDGSTDIIVKTTPVFDSLTVVNWVPNDPTLIIGDDPYNRKVIADLTTTFTVEVNSGIPGCSTTESIRIAVIPNDVALVNKDTAVCYGTIIPLSANGHPALNYRWTPSDDVINPNLQNTFIVAKNSGEITLTASLAGCTDQVRKFYLDVQPIPTIDMGKDITLCQGDTAKIFVSVTPEYDKYKYQWTPEFKLTAYDKRDVTFIGNSSEQYIFSATTPIGCTASDTLNVTVHKSDFLQLNITDTTICPGTPLNLIATGGNKYKWTPNTDLSNADTARNQMISGTMPVTYLVKSTSEYGCVDSEYVDIKLSNNVSIDMPDSISIYPGEVYNLDIITNAHYFNWYPPEGLSSTKIANPDMSPEVRTRYYVTANLESGCSLTDSIDVIVNNESIFDLPNAFNPGNSNSVNGLFGIKNRGTIQLKKFTIYDRWGQVMFETNDINRKWDGTKDGKAQPMGVYVYYIEAALSSGRVITKNGNVTLLR